MKKVILCFLVLFFFSWGVFAQSYGKGGKVEIKWGGKWFNGVIKEVKGDEYKIAYDGYSSSWDEWVKADRLRIPAKTESLPINVKGNNASKAPVNAPMGEYAVYQWNGSGFNYQYRFTLKANGEYHQFDDDKGTYVYNSSTKVIQFKTGPLKDFTGLYYTNGRNNEKGEPVIALDFNGKVPDLSKASLSSYQYAYFRPEGVK